MHISVKTLENSAAKTLEVCSLQCATTGSDSNLWCWRRKLPLQSPRAQILFLSRHLGGKTAPIIHYRHNARHARHSEFPNISNNWNSLRRTLLISFLLIAIQFPAMQQLAPKSDLRLAVDIRYHRLQRTAPPNFAPFDTAQGIQSMPQMRTQANACTGLRKSVACGRSHNGLPHAAQQLIDAIKTDSSSNVFTLLRLRHHADPPHVWHACEEPQLLFEVLVSLESHGNQRGYVVLVLDVTVVSDRSMQTRWMSIMTMNNDAMQFLASKLHSVASLDLFSKRAGLSDVFPQLMMMPSLANCATFTRNFASLKKAARSKETFEFRTM